MGTVQRLLTPALALPVMLAGPAPTAVSSSTERTFVPAQRQEITFARFDAGLGDFSLWSARRDGSHQLRLSTRPSFFSDWSPDRALIVYDFFEGPDEHLGLVSPDGGKRVQLTGERGIQEAPKWSPDGRRIAYDASALRPDEPGFSTSIWIMDADGSRRRRITDDGFDVEPVFSPDGRQIAFGRITGIDASGVQQEAIWVMSSDGSHRRQVVPPELGAAHPDWSPDGRWIAFTTEPGGSESILRVRPDGTGLRTFRPATRRYQFYKAVWAHNGRSLLVGCNDLHTHVDKLCTMDARGRHVRLIIDSSPRDVNYPGR